MIEAMCPKDSVPRQFLENVEIEVSNDEEVVSVGFKLKEDSDNLRSLIVLAAFERLKQNLHSDIHVALELKHDLHSLFGESKKLTSLITDGLLLFAHVKTNSPEFYKTVLDILLELDKKLEPAVVLLKTFFQREFNFSIGLDELNLASICGNNCEELNLDTSILSAEPIKSNLGQVAAMMQNPPMPILGEVADLLTTQLKANFSCTLKLSEFVLTFHVKTAGVKELIEKGSK